MQANIQPVTFYPNQATVLKINGVRINSLGENTFANITCSFMSAQGQTLSSTTVDMPSSVYDTWGTDDTVVLDFAIQALGLVKS